MTTFVRPISVSHLVLCHARTIVSNRSQCYFSRRLFLVTVMLFRTRFSVLEFSNPAQCSLVVYFFRTCIFRPYTFCHFVLHFSILAFSSTCNFSAPAPPDRPLYATLCAPMRSTVYSLPASALGLHRLS